MGIKADMIAGEAAMEELESIINGEILAENFMLEDTVVEDLQSSVESDFSSEEENTTIEELDLREERSFSDEDMIDEDIELFRKRQNNPLFASFHTPYIDSVMNDVEDIKNLVNIEDLGADTSPIDEAYPTPYDWVEYENDVAEVTAENNDIVEVFGEQFATIAATGGNLLSAWLLISAYFHVCKVAGTWVPGKLTKERSASLVSEYGHLILRAATKSVEEISRFTASLGSNNMPPAPQQQQKQQKQHLPPRWQQLFHEFSLQGFEHEDLMMQFRKLLGETSNPKIAETIFEQTFRNLSAETRLLNFAPALQRYFFFPHSSCSSPSSDETTSDDDDALRALITKFNPEANLMFLNNTKKNKRGNTRISEKEKGRLFSPPTPPPFPYPVSKRTLQPQPQSQGQSQEKKKKMQKTKTEKKKKKKTVKKRESSNDGSKKKVGGGVSAGRVMKKGKPVTAAAAAGGGTKMTNSATATSNTAATIGARRYNLRKRK